jgi:hypothetical protein
VSARAFVLPTQLEPGFVETLGIAWPRSCGPVITTLTGGTGEAVGDPAVIVEAGDVQALRAALDRVVLEMPEHERCRLERRGGEHARAFDRGRVFDDLFRAQLPTVRIAESAEIVRTNAPWNPGGAEGVADLFGQVRWQWVARCGIGAC